jgi:hypothetical protein
MDVENLTSDRVRTPNCPVRSESICPLRGSVHWYIRVYTPDHSISSFVRRTVQITVRGSSESSCQVQSTSRYTACKLQYLYPQKPSWSPPLKILRWQNLVRCSIDVRHKKKFTEKVKARHHVEYLGVNDRVILKWILWTIGCMDVEWIHLLRDRDQRLSVMKKLMNFPVPSKAAVFA